MKKKMSEVSSCSSAPHTLANIAKNKLLAKKQAIWTTAQMNESSAHSAASCWYSFLIRCDSQSEMTGLFKGLSRANLNAARTRQKKKIFRCLALWSQNMLTIRCEKHSAYRWSIVSVRAKQSIWSHAGLLRLVCRLLLEESICSPLYCQSSWSENLNRPKSKFHLK